MLTENQNPKKGLRCRKDGFEVRKSPREVLKRRKNFSGSPGSSEGKRQRRKRRVNFKNWRRQNTFNLISPCDYVPFDSSVRRAAARTIENAFNGRRLN